MKDNNGIDKLLARSIECYDKMKIEEINQI